MNTVAPIIQGLVNDKTKIDWNYFHVFTVDISFTQSMDPMLENISELDRDKLYNECKKKDNGEKIFFESFNNYINDIVFKKRKIEHFVETKKEDTIEGFSEKNTDIIEGFDISTVKSINSEKFQLFTKTSEYKNYKLFFMILIIIIISFTFFKNKN